MSVKIPGYTKQNQPLSGLALVLISTVFIVAGYKFVATYPYGIGGFVPLIILFGVFGIYGLIKIITSSKNPTPSYTKSKLHVNSLFTIASTLCIVYLIAMVFHIGDDRTFYAVGLFSSVFAWLLYFLIPSIKAFETLPKLKGVSIAPDDIKRKYYHLDMMLLLVPLDVQLSTISKKQFDSIMHTLDESSLDDIVAQLYKNRDSILYPNLDYIIIK